MAEFTISGSAGDKAHVRPVRSSDPDGEKLTRFSLAVHRGRDRQVTDWYDCVAFGSAGSRAAAIAKGDRVLCKGRIELTSFEVGGRTVKRASFIVTYVEVYGGTKKEVPCQRSEPAETEAS